MEGELYTEYDKRTPWPVKLHIMGKEYGFTIMDALELTRMLTEAVQTALEQGAKL